MAKDRINTKAAQRRHQRNIQRAAERRAEKIAKGTRKQREAAPIAQAKIDKKAAQRRRFATLSPAHKFEEHRAPRHK